MFILQYLGVKTIFFIKIYHIFALSIFGNVSIILKVMYRKY